MRTLLKIAARYQVKLGQVFSQAYKDLVQLNNLAQSLSVDPYGTKDAGWIQKAKALAKTVAVLVDKAYRAGLSQEEMSWALNKFHSQLSELMVGGDADSKDELLAIQKTLSKLVPVELPAQMQTNKQIGQTYQYQDDSTVPDDIWTGQSVVPEDPEKLRAVVDKLVEDAEAPSPSTTVDWK